MGRHRIDLNKFYRLRLNHYRVQFLDTQNLRSCFIDLGRIWMPPKFLKIFMILEFGKYKPISLLMETVQNILVHFQEGHVWMEFNFEMLEADICSVD